MRLSRALLLVTPGLLVAGPAAYAAGDYIVSGVQIAGNSLISTETIKAALQEHPGAQVTKSDILADQAAILDLYKQKKMGANIKTAIASRDQKHVTVMFTISDETAAAAQPAAVASGLVLGTVAFDGNSKVSTDDLKAAVAEVPGQKVTDDILKADAQKIGALYKAKSVGVAVGYATATPQPGVVNVTWKLTESAVKRKRPKVMEDSDEGMKVDE